MHKISYAMLVTGLVIGLPALAMAHVVIDPASATTETYQKLTFRVSHGCQGSPTTAMTITLPETLETVRPQIKTGWKITVKTKQLDQAKSGPHGHMIHEVPTQILWEEGNLPDGYYDEFAMLVKTPSVPQTMTFQVHQQCADQQFMDWTPTVTITAKETK